MPSNQKTTKISAKPARIVLAGGGSGGHITPLLSLAHALKERAPGSEVIYIGLKGEKVEGLDERFKVFDRVYRVRSGKLRRYHGQSVLTKMFDIKTLSLNFIDAFKVGAGYLSARRLLKRIRPDIVLSKGGYGALPVGLAAGRLRIPLITHDSDSVPGMTNRLVGRRAALHATSYPAELYENFYPSTSIRYTGLPLDERLIPVTSKLQRQYKAALNIPDKSFVLLVTGGGLGSKTLNDKTVALSKQFLRQSDNFILHFSGTAHVAAVESAYERILSPEQLNRVKVIGFTDELYVYTGAADTIVSRAGASSLAEIASQRKACIVIPATFLSEGHQAKNISDWREKNVILEASDDITPQNLLKLIERLKQNQHLREQLGQNFGSVIRTDGAERLAELILGFSQ